MTSIEQDYYWMKHALELAKRAAAENEVPIGAVLVQDNQLLAEGWNRSIANHDPTAHAEIIAMRQAAEKICNYRLLDKTIYVTLEPCTMCAAALIHARVERLVYGADDPKGGAVKSVLNLLDLPFVNHRIHWQGGILHNECTNLLQNFFKARR
jgi:tRNA(adenine34) deaminase